MVSGEVAAFLLRFETILAERHPGVIFTGMLPDQFACLLRVDGQETPVSLHDAYRHEQAFPSGFPEYVANLVDDIRAVGMDRIDDLDFATVATWILPQVRNQEWLQQQGCFGDSGLVYTRLNDDLVTVYVIDDANCMVFVCRAHLRRWHKTEADLHNLALANLARQDGARVSGLATAEGPMRIQLHDGYDAARVLLLDDIEGLLVAIPDRDVLWVGSEGQGVDLEKLMAETGEIAARSPHPVSKHVYRVTDGELRAVQSRE
ncbi:MAG: hypothetical protein U1E73_07980 [Planctomycetota bacterium]